MDQYKKAYFSYERSLPKMLGYLHLQKLDFKVIKDKMSLEIINFLWKNIDGCVTVYKGETDINNFKTESNYFYSATSNEENILEIRIFDAGKDAPKGDALSLMIIKFIEENSSAVITKREFEYVKSLLHLDDSVTKVDIKGKSKRV